MDPNASLASLLTNRAAVEQLIRETQQAAESARPSDPIPVRDVLPPVEVRGRIDLWIRFPSESYIGLSIDEIKQRVIDTLHGERSPWLPQIILGNLELWKERVVAGPEATDGTGVPGPHDQNNVRYAGDTPGGETEG